MTDRLESPTTASPGPTVAAALALIAGWTDLTEARRRDLANALRLLPRLEGRPAAAVGLDPVHSLGLIERTSAEVLGIRGTTLANRTASIRYTLRRIGLLAPTRVATPKASDPAWAGLLDALPAGPDFGRLRTFIAHCIAEGIGPEAVSNPTLEAYAERRAAERGGAKSRDHARRVGVQWNLAAKQVPEWPATRLGLRPQPLQRSLPLDAYPASLRVESEKYLQDIGASADDDIFSGDARPAPVKPSTVKTRKYCLRRLLWGAVQGGMPIETLTRLSQVPTPAFIKASLGWHHRRAGEVNADLGQLAATIASVANYLRLPAAEWAAIKPMLARATPEQRTEITDRLAKVLDALSDPEQRAKLLHLPAQLMREAASMRDGKLSRNGERCSPQPETAAWLAATAAAIEILLHAPMRLTNLQRLRLGTEVLVSQVSRKQWRGTLIVDGGEVKNKRRLEVPLQPETMALLREYLDAYRPSLPGSDSVWLFPGRGGPGQPRHKGAFGQAITEAIEQYVGVRATPHDFRAFAGALILEANPHAIDDVRAILGHAGFATALIFYRRCSQRDAANRLSATLSKQRRATKLSVTAQFLAPELRRQVRRA